MRSLVPIVAAALFAGNSSALEQGSTRRGQSCEPPACSSPGAKTAATAQAGVPATVNSSASRDAGDEIDVLVAYTAPAASEAHAQESAVEGFAPEPVCESVAQTGLRRCWTSTKGYGESTPSAHIADLGFACSTNGRDLLGVSFHAREGAAFASGNVTLAVRWDEGPVRSVPSAAGATRSEDGDGTLAYLYAVERKHVEAMLARMNSHRSLAVALPYTSGRAGWARFALAGAEAAVAATRLACARARHRSVTRPMQQLLTGAHQRWRMARK